MCVDVVQACDAADKGGGANQIGALHQFEGGLFESQPGSVKGAALMGDQYGALESMHLHKEFEFVDDALLLQMGLRMTRQAGRPARETYAVVSRKAQSILE